MSDYEWFDPHQVRDWLQQADDRLYYESRDYKAQHERDQREIAHLRGRVEGMQDFATKIAYAMPIQPLIIQAKAR